MTHSNQGPCRPADPSHPADLGDFYQHAPCGFHSLDAEGVVVEVNDTELEMLQLTRDEVVGRRRFIDFLTPLSKQRFVREFATFKKTGRVEQLEFELVRNDGTTVPVRLSATALYDERGNFVRSRSVLMRARERPLPEESLQRAYSALATLIDERTLELNTVIATLHEEIGERERAERLLRQSEERAVAVVNAAVDGMITMDGAGFVETVNHAGERIFGWNESALVGRRFATLLSAPHDAEHREDLHRYRESGDPALLVSDREMVGRRRDGASFPMEVSITPVQIGSRLLLHGTVRDLTERRRAEERLAQLQEEVRRNEMLAAIGSLVAGFAHEARNPLFGISAVLDAFTARFGERAEYAEHFALLRRDVGRLKGLMQDLLEFGRPAMELRAGDLLQVLDGAVAECALLAQQSGVAVEVRRELPQLVVALNDRLVHAVQNLLQNAIQFAPRDSSVTLEAAMLGDDSPWVECTVRDHGPGINPDDLAHLFEPFFTRRRGGTGLGLAIVQRIVDEHRGTVCASNHPEGGAVITMRLPLIASQPGRALS